MNFPKLVSVISGYVDKIPVIKIGLIIIGGFVLYFVTKHLAGIWMKSSPLKRRKIKDKHEEQKRTKTVHKFILNALKIVITFIVFFLILDQLGVNISPFLTGAGILGVAVGFGSQTLVKDYISGILILTEDQFRKGDEVEIAKLKGTIEDFNLRKTLLIDKNGVYHFVSNSQITTVSNFTRGKSLQPKKEQKK